MRKRITIAAFVLTLGVAVIGLQSCQSTIPNRDPSGELFPTVTGESLAGDTVSIPGAFSGKPVVMLLGYVQDAQFDADRWLYGLLQSGVDVQIREVPTIEGLFAGAFAGTIDDGMRKGIPSEDWASVVTVYDDAEAVVAFTGNENPRNVRVVLLGRDGRVAWYHDRGYSAGKMLELERAIAAL